MGYQQSFLQFKNKEVLKEELKKYTKRRTEGDQAFVLCVNRANKDIQPFVKGELLIVLGGERYAQRSKARVKKELGIDNVKSVVFIDNPDYCYLSDGKLGEFLDEHFVSLTKKETDELLA